jgi:iron complex outermembrane receptor protein
MYSKALNILCKSILVLPFMATSMTSISAELEELVVTAQKRSGSLQEVPISIVAFSGDEIERLNISNTIDLVKNIPGMTGVNNVGLPQAAAYFIRGIGQDESVSTMDPAVGTFVDGVFMSRQIANNSRLYDLESVEVLKGPQGTLYGRNTTGGAVRIITQKPTEETEGWVDLAYGEFETFEASAKFNFPITDNLFAKLTAFTIDQGEGFLENVTLNRDQWKRDATGARAQFLFVPSDRTEILFTVEQTEDNTGGIVGANKLSACCGDDIYKVESGLENTWAETDFTAYSMKATVDLKNDTQMEIILSDHDLTHSFNNDYSDQVVPAYSIPNLSDHEQKSYEMNFTGSGGNVQWAAGVSHYYEKSHVLFGDALFLFGGAVAGTFMRDLTNTTDATAIYADFDFDLGNGWGLTIGGRYTDDDRSVDVEQFIDLNGVPWTARTKENFMDRSGWLSTAAIGAPFDNATVEALGTLTSIDVNEFTSRIVVDYQPNDNMMFYASVGDSFKGGGWASRVTAASDFVDLRPEYVDNVEFGMKSQWMDDALRLNITYFNADYTDLQITAIDQVTGAFVYSNKADAEVDGFEGELLYAASDNLTLFANFATLDGGYTELRPGAEGIADKDLKRTPDFSYRLGVIYDTLLENGELNFTGVLNREDEYFNNQNNTPAGLRPAVSKIDLTFTYVPNDGDWRVIAGCTNCSDKKAVHSTLDFVALGFITQFQDLPRLWRVSYKYNF